MNNHFVLRNLGSNDNIDLDKPTITMGRSPECDIVVDSTEASREHVRLSVSGGSVVVEDLNSTNGTLLNNRRLRTPETLSGGDILIVGQVHYLVVAPGSTGNETILGGRLGPADNSFVVDESDVDKTGVRIAFSTPPGWGGDSPFGSSALSRNSDLERLSDLVARRSFSRDNTPAVLMLLGEESDDALFPLPSAPARDSWTIGRSSSCDVTVTDITVSATHAVISHSHGKWLMEDRESTNGSTVNGKRIASQEIKSGDKLGVGKVRLLFKSLS